MPREFGTPGGDNPQDRGRKRRQMPDAPLRNHADGEGKESKPRIRSASDVYLYSLRRAQGLFNREAWSRADEVTQLSQIQTVKNLAKLAAVRGDAEIVRDLGKLIEPVVTDHSPTVTELYFDAAMLDDFEATDRLHTLLQQEKDNALANGEVLSAQGKRPLYERPRLRNLIEACAKAQTPADNWIAYGLSVHDAARLKVIYLQEVIGDEDGMNEVAKRYRDEVTGQFLKGELNRDFSQNYTDELYLAQEDPHAKRLVFAQFRDMNEPFLDGSVSYKKIISFYAFAQEYLSDPGIARKEDASWIWETMTDLSNVSVTDAADLFTSLIEEEQKTAIAFARYIKAPAGSTVKLLDDIVSRQLERCGTESDMVNVTSCRNNRLWECATDAAKAGDLEAAKYFLATNASQSFAYLKKEKAFFSSLQTLDALAALKPEARTLADKDSLGEIFSSHEIFLRGDPEEIVALTNSLLEKDTKRYSLAGELFLKGIEVLYAHDSNLAHEVTEGYIAQINANSLYAGTKVEKIAEIQLAVGDPMGWQHHYELAEKSVAPELQAMLHSRLALRAARVMQKECIPFEEE